jgi:oligopeptide transport system permease protein
MARFVLGRLLQSLLVLWVVATATFALMRAVPGGPFDREKRLPPEVLAALQAKYHLDDPLLRQYLRFLASLARGDLGPSYKYLERGVNRIVAETLPVSAVLGLAALLLALLAAFPCGIAAAYWRGSALDRGLLALSTLGVSLPTFLLGALLIWIFSSALRWFPVGAWGEPRDVLLPAATLAAAPAAYLAHLIRAALLETLEEDFIRTARAKGLPERLVFLKHALRHSLLPVLTVLGPLAAALVTGSFAVEYVFAAPGMGRFFITAVTDRDYPLITGITLVYAALLVAANLAVDMLYAVVDPRIGRK